MKSILSANQNIKFEWYKIVVIISYQIEYQIESYIKYHIKYHIKYYKVIVLAIYKFQTEYF